MILDIFIYNSLTWQIKVANCTAPPNFLKNVYQHLKQKFGTYV